MLSKCPGFKQMGKGAGVMDVADERSHTVAGASWIEKEFSPSGQPEVVLGFRGTMFTSAKNELMTAISGLPATAKDAFKGVKTVLTDLTISKKMLEWPDEKTGKKIKLGYVHEG